MKANPGGSIGPSDVIGRDELIGRLWRDLERQGVVLTAERRLGKTCVVKKMEAEPRAGRIPLFRDLEQVHSTRDFTQLVLHDVHGFLGKRGKIMHRVRQLLGVLDGTEFAGFKLPEGKLSNWKAVLTRTIEDLMEHQEDTVVFLWDELPLMIENISKREGERTAMEVLDTLRALRQTHRGLRMLFTGSIGLHNVITSLKRAGYANSPVNDMHSEDVPPLDSEHARELARLLLEGERIQVEDADRASTMIAEAVDCIPYYIHHIVDRLATGRYPAADETIAELVEELLSDPHDRWHMRHYRERIDLYYGDSERSFVLGLLDVLAHAEEALPFDELFNRLKANVVTEDRETVLSLAALLQQDHYLVQRDGAYRFRFPLIRRWWRLHRGLGP